MINKQKLNKGLNMNEKIEKVFLELVEVIHTKYGIDDLIVESDLRGIGIPEKLERLFTQGEISFMLMNYTDKD